jgi:fatty aldehyde-generating acyl-ACP reductase
MELPYLPGRVPSFGFIVHPRTEKDIFGAKCFSLLREMSTDDADFVARVCSLAPTVVGEVLFGFSPFRGEIMAIPCLSEDVPTARGRRAIAQAAKIMADRGARVIGLGALTSPATAAGSWLVDQIPAGLTITNGNGYTAAVLLSNVLETVGALGLARPSRVCVVGCTGSVGQTLSRLLAELPLDLVLIGRRAAKVRKMFRDVAPKAKFSDELADVATADVIVLLTSAPSARIGLGMLGVGSVVIDASEPPNVSEKDAAMWSDWVTVTRGGRVSIPSYHCTCAIGFESSVNTFACLAETYLFVREGISEHSIGSPTPDFVRRIERVARRHGVGPSFELSKNLLLEKLSRAKTRRVSV